MLGQTLVDSILSESSLSECCRRLDECMKQALNSYSILPVFGATVASRRVCARLSILLLPVCGLQWRYSRPSSRSYDSLYLPDSTHSDCLYPFQLTLLPISLVSSLPARVRPFLLSGARQYSLYNLCRRADSACFPHLLPTL